MSEIIPILRRVVLLVITIYIAIAAILFFMQDRILFLRPGIGDDRIEHIRERFPDVEEVTPETPDNITLHGWLAHNEREEPAPLLIYFGGNAEEVSWMLEEKNHFPGWKILLVNYRGYGRSEGIPGEDAIMGDALFLFDEFSVRDDIDPARIVVMGRSLGCAPAIYLSASRDVAATILVSPFGSMLDLARDQFPFIPVGIMLRHRFNVSIYAGKASNPMLTLAASDDNLIPVQHSRNLFKAWEGPGEFVIVGNTGHNNITDSDHYWESIKHFLDTPPGSNLQFVTR